MKGEYVWEGMDDGESSSREKIAVNRMKWDAARGIGVPLSSDGNITLFGHLEPEWLEETEKQKFCGYWTEDNPHPFNEGGVCKLCGARKLR